MSKKPAPAPPPPPTFLPHLGEHLQKLFPLAHESLASVLGLAQTYMKAMHPVKMPQSDVKLTGSAHILSLFVNNPLIKAILPPATTPATTSKELTTLQAKFSTLESSIALLAKATKDPKTPPPTATLPAQPSPLKGKASVPPPTYAAKASSPQCPSIVMG